MRLLLWSILCWSLVMANEAVAADRAVRSLAFRKGSSFFVSIQAPDLRSPRNRVLQGRSEDSSVNR